MLIHPCVYVCVCNFLIKLYFIKYAITVVLIFPPVPLLHPALLTPSGNPSTVVHVHGSWISVLWPLHFLYCTVPPHGSSVTTDLCFLIPSPLHSFSHTSLPPGNHQNALRIYDSVSVLLVCVVSFLDSIIRYVFMATLLFIVLIFFFLYKSLLHFM